MPHFTTDESPFSVRRRPGKRQEELSRSQSASPAIKNPGMTGQASTSSTTSSGTRYAKTLSWYSCGLWPLNSLCLCCVCKDCGMFSNGVLYSSSTESEASDEDELSVVSSISEDEEDSNPSLSLTSFFPPMTETYGNYLQEPSRADSLIYKRWNKTNWRVVKVVNRSQSLQH